MCSDKKLPNPKLGSYHRLTLTRQDIERAVKNTKSNSQAARYCGVSISTYKKYAMMYNDENGNNYYTSHNNQSSLGIRKTKVVEEKIGLLTDVLTGKIPATNYIPRELKRKIIAEGFLEEKCSCCGFNEQRVYDRKVPLLMTFRDGDKKNWNLDNLELLCFNCYYLRVGEVFSKKQLDAIEGITTPKNGSVKDTLDIGQALSKVLEDEFTNRLKQIKISDLSEDDLIQKY